MQAIRENLMQKEKLVVSDIKHLLLTLDNYYKDAVFGHMRATLDKHKEWVDSTIRLSKLLYKKFDSDNRDASRRFIQELVADELRCDLESIDPKQLRYRASKEDIAKMETDKENFTKLTEQLSRASLYLVGFDEDDIIEAESNGYAYNAIEGWMLLFPLPKLGGEIIPLGIAMHGGRFDTDPSVVDTQASDGASIRSAYVDTLLHLQDANLHLIR